MAKRNADAQDERTSQDTQNATQNGDDVLSTKRKAKEGDRLINETNRLSMLDFTRTHIKEHTLAFSTEERGIDEGVRIDVKSAQDLSKDELNQCFHLIASTSRANYEASSWGWHPERKKREMQEAEMRYLLVRTEQLAGSSQVQGFLSFMLTHDSTPSVPVLYIYEIHLAADLRKLGLGAHLMQIAEDVAQSVGVEKVMLTCFLSNEKAQGFYKKRGYMTDVSSPEDRTTRRKVVKVDYVIMSRNVEAADGDGG